MAAAKLIRKMHLSHNEGLISHIKDIPSRVWIRGILKLKLAQMGGMTMGDGAGAGTARGTKKKNRHAFHTLESSSMLTPAYGGAPPGPVPAGGGYFGLAQQQAVGSQFGAANSPGLRGEPFNSAKVTPSPQFASGQSTPNAFNASMGSMGAPQGVSQQGKVDPEQIPSVPLSRDGPARYYLNHVYPTLEHHLPPPAAVPFVALDQGNSSPKFARLTMNNIPSTSEALASTGLPLGLLLQPLAALQPGEAPIPVLDFGPPGPPRCTRCRAYINPFMTFRSGGNRFVCNMCNFPNEVPSEYFSPTNPQGLRVDRDQRPELTRGTVEFMVPKEYWAKEPVGLRLLFVIEVGQEAVNRGYLEGFCEGILAALYGTDPSPGPDPSANGAEETPARRMLPVGAKVGIVSYDKEVHFYNLLPSLDKAQMMVMPDIEDPFVPLSDGLFVDPYEAKEIISALLTQLPSLFALVKNPEPALLPTLNAALAALASTGGKIICSLSALPTWGPGRLFLRDDGKMHSADSEKKLFTTDHPGWKKTAEKMVQSGVGVDLFLAAPSGGYLDIATIGHVSATTGGETFYYPNFHSPRDTLKLSQEIKHSVTRPTGYQALMKVRCSNGLQVSAYHGSFVQHTFGADLELGLIDSDKALGVMFSYDGKLDAKLDAHFQSALLYTTTSGERRVRCSNIVASVSEGGREGMRFVDQDAVVNLIAKEAASKVTERSLKEIRSGLTEKTIDILAGYRKNFSGSHPPGQLVLPENLKEFGMYILGLIKSRAFKGLYAAGGTATAAAVLNVPANLGGHEPTDRRNHELRMIKTMGGMELSLYLYPRIIAIHNLAEQDGFPDAHGHLQMPSSVRASFSRIEDGGAYVVDNGQVCLIWLHSHVSPNLLTDLFGDRCATLASLDPFMSALPVLDTHLNAQVRNLLQYLSTIRGSKGFTVQLARQGLDGAEYEFARLLVEDRNNEAQSYVDWLVHVHRHIQLETEALAVGRAVVVAVVVTVCVSVIIFISVTVTVFSAADTELKVGMRGGLVVTDVKVGMRPGRVAGRMVKPGASAELKVGMRPGLVVTDVKVGMRSELVVTDVKVGMRPGLVVADVKVGMRSELVEVRIVVATGEKGMKPGLDGVKGAALVAAAAAAELERDGVAATGRTVMVTV
ncbi:MAG: COPII coat Sec23p-Sfb3p heterodimer component [Phylliscum demangeonii]|nr:MAG: COPII coat Sec23p-Sfb3p heterodimer component [Phylliscum demangeonii]